MKIAKHKIGTHLAATMQPTAYLMSNLSSTFHYQHVKMRVKWWRRRTAEHATCIMVTRSFTRSKANGAWRLPPISI